LISHSLIYTQIKPDELIGTKWSVEKINEQEMIMEYFGRKEDVDPKKAEEKLKPEIKDNTLDQVKDVIKEIKPELGDDGTEESKFIKAVAIRSNLNDTKIKELIPDLKKDKIIMTHKGVVLIL